MKEELLVLLVEDNPNDAKLLALELAKEYTLTIRKVETEEDYCHELKSFNPDIILSDYTLPAFSGLNALLIRQQIAPLVPFILVTGSINEETAVEFIKTGADDYIIKEHLHRLLAAVKSAIEKKAVLRDKEQAEKSFAAINEFNQFLLRSIPFGMDIVDEQGTILFMSEILRQRFHEEVIGKNCWLLYKDDKKQCIDCPLNKNIGIGETSAVETENVFNGRTFEITHTGMLYQGKKAVLEIFQDITEKKEYEKRVRLLAHSLESISECVSITDNNERLIYVNESFLRTYGYTEAELIGQHISILRAPENIDKQTDTILLETIKSGWRGEIYNVRKDGTVFPILLSTSIIKDKYENPIALIGVAIDITEMKENREELIAAKEKAEEMSHLKSSFLANMSHELRTPLIGIMGFSEILSTSLDNPELIEMADLINRSGRRLSDTLNLILDLSKTEANKIDILTENVNITDTARKCVADFSTTAAYKNITLEFVSKNEDVIGKLDKRLFTGVLNNLISNAVKYTSKGGVIVEVGKETRADKSWLYVSIKDTGIGIKPEDHEKIFQEFRQVSEGLGRNFEGVGLGLTISKRITELMGGVISVESQLGVGSVFKVRFPAFTTTQEAPTPTEEIPISVEESVKTPSTKNAVPLLLHVEDDEISRITIKLFLKNVCELESATDGKTALDMAMKKPYDGFLMDINLGRGMDGLTVTKELRKIPQYANSPIVAITAFALEGDKEALLEGGCSEYLSKPFGKTELIGMVNKIFGEQEATVN